MAPRTSVRHAKEELHSDLLGRNVFVVTMIGAVAFIAASCYVMFH